MGRDMLSRVIKGAGISLSSSFALVVIITLTGCIAGIISGYYGGIIDSIIMRLSDIFLAFPGLVFAIAVASVMCRRVSKCCYCTCTNIVAQVCKNSKGRGACHKE